MYLCKYVNLTKTKTVDTRQTCPLVTDGAPWLRRLQWSPTKYGWGNDPRHGDRGGGVNAKTDRLSAAKWLGLVLSLQSIKPSGATSAIRRRVFGNHRESLLGTFSVRIELMTVKRESRSRWFFRPHARWSSAAVNSPPCKVHARIKRCTGSNLANNRVSQNASNTRRTS
jgi:hypothetical protein